MDAAKRLVIREVIERLINGKDYRIVTQTQINGRFLTYCLDFFKKVVEAKMDGTTITEDWYKENFVMNDNIKPVDRAIYAGINKKTISNMFNSGRKEIVVTASEDNYDTLVSSISHLIAENEDLDLLVSVGEKISGNTICALGDAAATPVESFIRHFRHEFEYYIKHGRSIVESEHNLIEEEAIV